MTGFSDCEACFWKAIWTYKMATLLLGEIAASCCAAGARKTLAHTAESAVTACRLWWTLTETAPS